MDKKEIENKIAEIELQMNEVDFWVDKNKAQGLIKELQELKDAELGVAKYDKKSALVTIFSGAGGDDAEDFTRMLFEMYSKYASNHNFGIKIEHEHKADSGGYRTISFEITGKTYGLLMPIKNDTLLFQWWR